MIMKTKTFNMYSHENQAVQDAYAMLAANINLNSSERKIKSIVMTSCKPRVGKTSLAINLAIMMAQSGWKVLLVDADLRKPSNSKRLNDEELGGLSEYLAGESKLFDVTYQTSVHNLSYISCGGNYQNPIGLLCSANFDEMMDKVRNEYDFIIFDTPSLATVADASFVAAKVDTSILVVEMGQTNLETLKKAKEQLEKVNADILGVVLNKVNKSEYVNYFEAYDYFFRGDKPRKKLGKKKPTLRLGPGLDG